MKNYLLAFFGLLALANAQKKPPQYGPTLRYENTKDKREANPGIKNFVYGAPLRAGLVQTPKKAYADPGYEQPAYSNGYGYAKRSAPDSSSDPYSQDPYLPAEHRQVGILQPAKRSAPDSSNDPNLPAEHRQVGILQPAKRSAPDASDYGVGYGDIWDMATPAVYDYQMQYKYDDGPQRRFTRDVKAAYARHVAKSKNLVGQVVRGNGDGPPSRVDRVN